jgi:hypothetical protein
VVYCDIPFHIKDKNKILGDKFENINANHVKNPGRANAPLQIR